MATKKEEAPEEETEEVSDSPEETAPEGAEEEAAPPPTEVPELPAPEAESVDESKIADKFESWAGKGVKVIGANDATGVVVTDTGAKYQLKKTSAGKGVFKHLSGPAVK